MAKPTAATPSRRGQARREQILAIAVAAFAAQGYRGTSLGAIAAEASISEPGLIHHFPSKSALLIAVLQHFQDGFDEWAREHAASGQSFSDLLIEIARFHEADPSFIRFFIVLSAESVEPAHPGHAWFAERYVRTRAFFAAGLAADVEHGVLAAGTDAVMLSRLVIALLDGLELQYLLSDGRWKIADPLETFLATYRA